MDKQRILIVDDDKDIVNLVKDILSDEGYDVIVALTGDKAVKLIMETSFDLIILDIMLPDMDGLEVCRRVRDIVNIPILFLSAKTKNIDKIIGFELGADDYITKPFDDNELIARVRAHLRRQKRGEEKVSPQSKGIISYKSIEINRNSYEVCVEEKKVELSTREFQILAFFMENSNVVLTREQIYNNVWGFEGYGDINTVTVHIKKLREKIDKNGKFLKTIWGVGYKFIGEKE